MIYREREFVMFQMYWVHGPICNCHNNYCFSLVPGHSHIFNVTRSYALKKIGGDWGTRLIIFVLHCLCIQPYCTALLCGHALVLHLGFLCTIKGTFQKYVYSKELTIASSAVHFRCTRSLRPHIAKHLEWRMACTCSNVSIVHMNMMIYIIHGLAICMVAWFMT